MDREHLNNGAFWVLGLLFLSLLGSLRWRRYQRRHLPLPPGPKPLPVIGCLLDLPESEDWLKYSEWNRKYGMLLLLLITFSQNRAQHGRKVTLSICVCRGTRSWWWALRKLHSIFLRNDQQYIPRVPLQL